MTGLQTLKRHLEAMLELTTEQIEAAQRTRLKADADEWDKAYACGQEDAAKVEKAHVAMFLELLKSEVEKTTEIGFSSLKAKPAA